MATLKKYNLKGEELGSVEVSDRLAATETNSQLIKDYIVAIRKNARQWSANTKGRSEVMCTGKKPHAQKGTGKARQGSFAASQYKGGGVVFGPKPKFDQHVKINRKERRAALSHLLGELIRNERVVVVDNAAMPKPSTKELKQFLGKADCQGRVLFLNEGQEEIVDERAVSVASSSHRNLALSVRNIPKVQFALAKNINGYALALTKSLVVTEAALRELEQWLVPSEGVEA